MLNILQTQTHYLKVTVIENSVLHEVKSGHVKHGHKLKKTLTYWRSHQAQ